MPSHGWSGTPTYRSWCHIKSRCRNPKFPGYDDYGARGIIVHERWNKFENFLADMGPRPEGTSIDRYPDGTGNYEPGNCRWATTDQQLVNRCDTVLLTIDGITKPYIEWERETNLPRRMIYNRIFISGWDPKEAINTPKGTYKKSGLYINHRDMNGKRPHRGPKLLEELPKGISFGRPQESAETKGKA